VQGYTEVGARRIAAVYQRPYPNRDSPGSTNKIYNFSRRSAGRDHILDDQSLFMRSELETAPELQLASFNALGEQHPNIGRERGHEPEHDRSHCRARDRVETSREMFRYLLSKTLCKPGMLEDAELLYEHIRVPARRKSEMTS
jgi:hypothetical protein